jgi:hypothetical protein
MYKWLHTASRVVDPLKRDSSGERTVGLFTPESGGKYTAILVVKGAWLIWISSSSVETSDANGKIFSSALFCSRQKFDQLKLPMTNLIKVFSVSSRVSVIKISTVN